MDNSSMEADPANAALVPASVVVAAVNEATEVPYHGPRSTERDD